MLPLAEEALARVEAFLGWAMLACCRACCKSSVTALTQRRVAEGLRLEWPLSKAVAWNSIGRYVQKLLATCVGPGLRRGRAREIADMPLPTISAEQITRKYGLMEYTRVRVEHITRWCEPSGRPYSWPTLRASFPLREFNLVADWAAAESNIEACDCWRHVSTHQLQPYYEGGDEGYAEVVTTTVRFLRHGFHVELGHLSLDHHYPDSDSDSDSDSGSDRDSYSSPTVGEQLDLLALFLFEEFEGWGSEQV